MRTNETVNDQPERIHVAAIKKMEAKARQSNVNFVIDYKRKPTDLDQPLIPDTSAVRLKSLLL